MTMATRLQNYLAEHHSRYDMLQHDPSMTSREAARRAGVPPHLMAKSVILDDFAGNWLMAVVPATHQVDLSKVHRLTKRQWRLASEDEFGPRFRDCAQGAIPPVGEAFEMDTLIDESLKALKDLYFESGDHEGLVHMSAKQFRQLMPHAQWGAISE